MTDQPSRDPTAIVRGTFDLARLPATDLIAGYRSGRFTPVDVIDEVIGALEATDALCNVVVTDMYDAARTEAERAASAWAAGDVSGALTGVPVSIKDLLFVGGVGAHAGAPTLAEFVPDQDFSRRLGAQVRRRGPDLQNHHLRVRLQADGGQPANGRHA